MDLKTDILKSLGFDADPFQYINADQEDRLDSYFVDPPYFQSLWGNPERPESHVVLAPRGGGKSAQRRMLEVRALNENVFAVTYDRFFTTTSLKSLDDANLAFHVSNLNKLFLISFFGYVADKNLPPNLLFRDEERHFLTKMIDVYLGEVDMPTIRDIVNRSMTIPAKFKKWWNENLPFLGLAAGYLKSKFGLETGGLKSFEHIKVNEDPLTHFQILIGIIKEFGFKTCYILVDKVDETELTGNNAQDAYALIRALIKDLRFINSNEFGMKFFLWDALEPYYAKDARRDRVQEFRLEWKISELKAMLSRRMAAHSNGLISRLQQIFDIGDIDVIDIIIAFSENSPRNIIRMLQDIIDDHARKGIPGKIKVASLDAGIKKFCSETARGRYGNEIISDLKRISKIGFTTNFLSSDLLRSPNAARRKIQLWDKDGLIKQICTVPNKIGRPSPYYLLKDVMLVPIVLESSSVLEITKEMAVKCNYCDRTFFLHKGGHRKFCVN